MPRLAAAEPRPPAAPARGVADGAGRPVRATSGPAPRAAEFFAGIGLVRLGLEAAGFEVAWSNDVDPAKRAMYEGHFRDGAGRSTFVLGDVAAVRGGDLPAGLALAWASFPCVDLSLAGWRRGLAGAHSSTFWHFARVLAEMGSDRPPVVALENVVGLATSRAGEDLAAAVAALNRLGYSADVLTLDARRFVPQSRPRLFVIGLRRAPAAWARPAGAGRQGPPPASAGGPAASEPGGPTGASRGGPAGGAADGPLRPGWLWAPLRGRGLVTHRAPLPEPPPILAGGLSSLIAEPAGDAGRGGGQWWDVRRTEAFLASLSPVQAGRLAALQAAGSVRYRTAYRRTRKGRAVWEIRPDDIAGCLRTARGGSSKQALVRAGRGAVAVRWMTPREYARLMGAGLYRLDGIPGNQALFGFGDAVCVPVVAWLAEHYLLPLATGVLRP